MLQPSWRDATRDLHVPVGREFDGVGEQVLEDLLQPLGIALHEVRQALGELHVERQVLGLGDMAEVAFDVFAQPVERDFLDLDCHRAGFDFREIENIVDEVEQVGAGRVDVAGKLDLPVGKVAWRRFRQAAG